MKFVRIIIALFTDAFKSIFSLFKRDRDFTSDRGKKVLADKEEKEKFFKAMKDGKTEVETKFGMFHFL